MYKNNEQEGGGKITSAGTEVDVDQLKKRADRFGTVTFTSELYLHCIEKQLNINLIFYVFNKATSTALKKAEVSEAIKRRQERFGVITADEPKVLLG